MMHAVANFASAFLLLSLIRYILWQAGAFDPGRSVIAFKSPFMNLTAHQPPSVLSYETNANVNRFVKDLSAMFLGRMRQLAMCQMRGRCPMRVLTFDCSNSSLSYGGVGDRMKGMSNLFYAAWMSNRVLLIDWQTPADLAEVFDINEGLYVHREFMGKYRRYVVERRHRPGFTAKNYFFSLAYPIEYFRSVAELRVSMNDLTLLENVIPMGGKAFKNLTALLDKHNLKASYELLSHAALNVLLQSPKRRLREFLERLWQPYSDPIYDGCRFGFHIRVAPPSFFQKYQDKARLNDHQIDECFIRKTLELAAMKCAEQKAIVHVASDSSDVKKRVLTEMKRNGIQTGEEPSTISEPVHIDSGVAEKSMSDEARLDALAETIAEWMILSRMDQLIISRSGFGEMASTFGNFRNGRKPTLRLPLKPASKTSDENECSYNENYFISFAYAE